MWACLDNNWHDVDSSADASSIPAARCLGPQCSGIQSDGMTVLVVQQL